MRIIITISNKGKAGFSKFYNLLFGVRDLLKTNGAAISPPTMKILGPLIDEELAAEKEKE